MTKTYSSVRCSNCESKEIFLFDTICRNKVITLFVGCGGCGFTDVLALDQKDFISAVFVQADPPFQMKSASGMISKRIEDA